jgi:hypothetical protein
MSTNRELYELSRRNQAAMLRVEDLLIRDSRKVLAKAKDLPQQPLGAFLRLYTPGLIEKHGNINAAGALTYYNERYLLYAAGVSSRVAARAAAKATQGAIYVARIPQFNPTALAEGVINYGMSSFSTGGFGQMERAVTSSLTRAVAGYNRDTILYNSALDPGVITVQRVAEADSCAFCQLMAFSSTRSASGNSLDVRTSQYAVDFHDRCRCSIETLYQGDSPIRPPYYDKFEDSYIEATKKVSFRDTEDVLAAMRVIGSTN